MKILLNETLVNTVEVLMEKFRKGLITFEQYVKALRKRFLNHQHNVLQDVIIEHRRQAESALRKGQDKIRLMEEEIDKVYMEKLDKRCEMIDRKRKIWYKY